MSCVDVEVRINIYYSGDTPKYEAVVTKIANWPAGDILGNWFIGDSSNAAIGKMISSEWADEHLFRHGKQACRFVFKGDVNARV